MAKRYIQDIMRDVQALRRNIKNKNKEELIEILDNLKKLMEESDYDEGVAIEYAKSFHWLIMKQNFEGKKESVLVLEALMEKFPDSSEIAIRYAQGSLNLFKGNSLKENELILDKLEELSERFDDNEEINIQYAKALLMVLNDSDLEEKKVVIKKLENLKDKDSSIDDISYIYAEALNDSIYYGDLALAEESSNKLDELLYIDRKNDEVIANLYSDSLVEIIKLQSQKVKNEGISKDLKERLKESLIKSLKELENLVENFKNDKIKDNYSKGLTFLIAEEDLNKKEEDELLENSKKIFDGRTAPVNSTATSKDYLNREHISNAISLYIRAKKESISTIGIFSTWGNGKSSFIKNILEKLKEKPDKNEVEILPIEIDAVFSDDCEKIWIIIYKKLIEEYKNQISNCQLIQNFLKLLFHLCSIGILYLLFPLLSIKPLSVYGYIFLLVYSVIFLLFIEFKKYYKWLNNLSLKIQDFLLETIIYFKLFYKPTIILIANVVMFFMLKNDVIKYTEKVKFANLEINKVSLITGIISFIWIFCDFTKNIVSVLNKESFISAYKHEEKLGFKSVIHEKINNVIEKIINGEDRKILIIVDELDRSSLDKINEIIESTHILLNNNNLMFLFSVNPRQIGKALLLKEEESLGNEIDIYKHGRHYIEKYMDIYLYLPFPKDYSSLLDNIIDERLEEKVIKDSSNVPTSSPTSSPNKSPRNSSNNSTIPDNNKIKEIMKFPKDEKQEIKITINKIAEYMNLTPRKVKTIITLSTLSVQIFNARRGASTKKERLSLMKFILINLGLLDFMDMSELLKEKNSVYIKFLEKIALKTGEEDNEELVKDIDIDFIDSYGKEYLSFFAEKLDFN